MDMASTAILSGLMRGNANSGGTPLTDICGSAEQSFKSVMSGILTQTAPSADASLSESMAMTKQAENPMEQLSIATATGKMLSVGNEAALKYFMGTYLSQKQSGMGENNVFSALLGESESGDYSEVWGKLMETLSASDIADMSAFSAEMETFLFTGETRRGNKDKNLGSSLADVFNDMDLRIMAAKSKKDPEDEVNAIMASLAVSTQIVQTQSFPTDNFVPDPVLGSEDRMALTALLENSDDEVIRDLAKELTAVFTSRLSEIAQGGQSTERIVNAFEATVNSIASYGAEKTVLEDVISKLEAVLKDSGTVEITFNEEIPTDIQKNDSIDPRLEALGSAGQAANIRNADVTERNADDIPRVTAPVKRAYADEEDAAEEVIPVKKDDVKAENVGAENIPVRTETAVKAAPVKNTSASEGTNFKTMEQVISEIRKITAEPLGAKGSKELTIKLRPETLGEITVKITKGSDGNLDITLAAHNRDVSDLLKANSAQLANSLADKGAEVRSVNIVEPSQADQSIAFSMNGNGGYDLYGDQTRNTGGSAGRHSGSDEDEDDMTISAADNNADDSIYSREAKLWAKI